MLALSKHGRNKRITYLGTVFISNILWIVTTTTYLRWEWHNVRQLTAFGKGTVYCQVIHCLQAAFQSRFRKRARACVICRKIYIGHGYGVYFFFPFAIKADVSKLNSVSPLVIVPTSMISCCEHVFGLIIRCTPHDVCGLFTFSVVSPSSYTFPCPVLFCVRYARILLPFAAGKESQQA